MGRDIRKILVTGSSGFIGSHLVEEFISLGIEVVGLDKSPSSEDFKFENFEERVGDVGDTNLVRELTSKVDLALHIAAKPSVPDSWETPDLSLTENVSKTAVVLDACSRAQIPVFIASSSSVYGFHGSPSNPYQPISPYGVSKAAMEMLHSAYQTQRNLEGGTFRFFNVFGPRHRINVSNPPVIAKIMECLRKDEPFSIHGDGEQSRDFTFVKDLTRAVMDIVINRSSLSKPVEVSFNRTISLNNLILAIENVAGKKLSINRFPGRLGDIKTSAADGSIEPNLTQPIEPTPLSDALAKTWAWHLNLPN